MPLATLSSSSPEIGSPVVISLSEREEGEEEEEEEEEDEMKPLSLQSAATSLGSSIASLPLPVTNVIPGGGVESGGGPLRKDRRPESGDDDWGEEGEEEEEVFRVMPRRR